jgi:hypothetical protein
MKKFILAGVSGLALLTVAACSDSTDNTTTQSVEPMEETVPATPPATNVTPPPADEELPAEPAPTEPAPAE